MKPQPHERERERIYAESEPNQNAGISGYDINQVSDRVKEVRLNIGSKRHKTKKRISRAVSKANRIIKVLKQNK